MNITNRLPDYKGLTKDARIEGDMFRIDYGKPGVCQGFDIRLAHLSGLIEQIADVMDSMGYERTNTAEQKHG